MGTTVCLNAFDYHDWIENTTSVSLTLVAPGTPASVACSYSFAAKMATFVTSVALVEVVPRQSSKT